MVIWKVMNHISIRTVTRCSVKVMKHMFNFTCLILFDIKIILKVIIIVQTYLKV